MKINPHNPMINPINTQNLDQAAREAGSAKAAEVAKHQQEEESLKLQRPSESPKKKEVGGKKDSESNQGRRNARYLPDGTVVWEEDESPDDGPPPASHGIDIRA